MTVLLRTVAVVGGGFCGTVLAANLLRHRPALPTRIVLFERGPAVGRGVAYSERGHGYLLNVPASRMSATSAAPDEFLQFARRRIPQAGNEDFLPRSLYGEYLEQLLLAAQLNAPPGIGLEIRHREVVAIRRIDRSLPLHVETDDGRTLVADDVVLAVGNPPPTSLPVTASVADHPAYIADPWQRDLRFAGGQTVMLIGTGLTAADVISSAVSDERNMPTLHALSRHGLVPPRQSAFRPDAFRGNADALLLAASTSVRRLTRSVRVLAEEAERCGGDWREAITFVRHMAPTLWQHLPQRDRARFLEHLRAYWDIHRHRLPSEVLQHIELLRRTGRLHVHAGRILKVEPHGERIALTWRPRGASDTCAMVVDWLINCTGPDYAITRSREPLWRNLLQCGLCTPDPLGLGLRTGPAGAVIDADGWPGPHLFYLGPMLRADHWEATAAAELRDHAEHLAGVLANDRT